MLKSLSVIALLFSTAAPAQIVTSYRTANPSHIKGNPNRIVCQKEETIGTRLGAKKVCLTVKEWQDRAAADRTETERIQQSARAPSSGG